VKAIIDVGDFLDLRGNTSKSPEWNGGRYHDLGVHLSALIQQHILTWDPADIRSDEIHIPPPRRPRKAAGTLAATVMADHEIVFASHSDPTVGLLTARHRPKPIRLRCA